MFYIRYPFYVPDFNCSRLDGGIALNIRSVPSVGFRFISACIRFRANPVKALMRFVKLYRRELFAPDEIYFHRLLDPAIDDAVIRRMISKEKMLKPQLRLNPSEFRHYVDNKVTFHAECARHGLPTPELFAIVDPAGGSAEIVRVLRTPQQVESFLKTTPNNRMMLKPADGYDGVGVDRLERRGDHWYGLQGEQLNPSLAFFGNKHPESSRWLFQQVVSNHPELFKLTGAIGLQTLRVRTVVNSTGEPEILAALLRLISGDHVYDNFRGGATGNMIALLDAANGRIVEVVASTEDHHEICSVTAHPVTGKSLIGFTVPHWEAIHALALQAAVFFLPLRCIGWDIAITDTGPLLIEGNITWGILNRERDAYDYLLELSANNP